MRNRKLATTIIALIVFQASPTKADALGVGVKHIQTLGPRKLCKLDEPQTCLIVQPGRFIDDAAWNELDTEIRRLQDAETRLSTENKFMHEKTKGWRPGWRTLLVTLATGFAGGVVAYHYVR